jgi:hypothetical protein
MKNVNINFSKAVRGLAIAAIVMGIAAAPGVDAKAKPKEMAGKAGGKIILVNPSELPELARQAGEAMLLHDTGDGRKLLYIEQNHGARLAIFDVTDPSDVRGEESVQLDVPGPFEFVVALGDHAELVRFRQGQGEAVLDLHKVKAPVMKMVQGLKLQGATERLGEDGFIVANQANVQAAPYARDFQVVETGNLQELNRVFDVARVCEELTSNDTGTTFLLTTDGLYLIRRPAVEEEFKTHEEQLNRAG